MFAEVESISKEFERRNLGYRHSSYLVYIATVCITTPGHVIPFTLGAGQGKTFITLLLAAYHARHDKIT